MIGERHFATRERLAELLQRAEAEAKLVGAPYDAEALTSLQARLAAPIHLAVCGEALTGKSALLNALVGHDLCPVHPHTQAQGVVVRYQHGKRAARSDIEPGVVQDVRRNDPFLNHFELIDTPGLSECTPETLLAVESLVRGADLILVVFSPSDPWGATTWNLLQRQRAAALSRTALVLQQCDKRDASELEILDAHMRELCMKRLGRELPIFHVSANVAFQAKYGPVPPLPGIWQESDFAKLEGFLNRLICDGQQHKELLEDAHRQSFLLLRKIEDQLDTQNRGFDREHHFLEHIERGIDQLRESFVQRLPMHLAHVADAFRNAASTVTTALRWQLGPVPSLIRLFGVDRVSRQIESRFLDKLSATVEKVAASDSTEVAAICVQHWETLRPQFKDRMGIELHPPEALDQALAKARDLFAKRLQLTAQDGRDHLRIRHGLDHDLRHRNRLLKWQMAVTLFILLAAGVLGVLGVPWLPPFFAGLALAAFVWNMATALQTRKVIATDFHDRLMRACDTFALLLKDAYEDALTAIFRAYAAELQSVRQHLAAEKLQLEPRQHRWDKLFLTLKAIEQEL